VLFDCSKLYISECLSHSLFYLPSLIASYSVRNGSALHAHGSAIFRIVVEHPTKSSLDHVGYASWKSWLYNCGFDGYELDLHIQASTGKDAFADPEIGSSGVNRVRRFR